MTSSPPSPFALRLLLIDEDPVFRLGIRVWLNQYADVNLIEAEDGETALQILDHQFARPIEETVDETIAETTDRIFPVNLIVLDIGLGRTNPEQLQGLNLCAIVRSRYPRLPILGIGTSTEPVILAAAQQAGANGYCAKTAETGDLLAAMRAVAAGQSYWLQTAAIQTRPITQATSTTAPTTTTAITPMRPVLLATFRRNLRLSGVRQIDAALAEVTAELQNLDLPLLERAVIAGQQRELKAARWFVSRLLATPSLENRPPFNRVNRAAENQPRPATPTPSNQPTPAAIVPLPAAEPIPVERQSIQSLIFDAVLTKLQTSLTNQTEIALETDILQESKKRELFYLTLRKFEEILAELRYSQVTADQLPAKQTVILLDLWQAVLLDFFGRYYTVQLGTTDVEVVAVLLQDAAIIRAAILDKLPGVIELLQHLLFEAPLAVDNVLYAPGNPESLARAELLLENLIIQLGNAVMQPLLNHFANVEAIKQTFYDRRLLSSREIERFRNNLSWKYRLERVFREPKNIFESQYQLLTLTGRGIKQTTVYAPRLAELEQLSGLPYVVTLVLETRDAVAPRVRAVVSFVGNGLVYVLTEVIGRGIGLIGRGVLKGLGNVWQDPSKYGRDRQQR